MIKKFFIGICCFLTSCSSVSPTYKVNIFADGCVSPSSAYSYQLCHNLIFEINDIYYIIPRGFKTDLATIPRILWPIVSPMHSKLITPAIIHDWMYSQACLFERKEADLIFFDLLVKNEVSLFRAYTLYYAARIFGGRHYLDEDCDRESYD